MFEETWGKMPEGPTTEHYVEFSSIENSNSLTLLTPEHLE